MNLNEPDVEPIERLRDQTHTEQNFVDPFGRYHGLPLTFKHPFRNELNTRVTSVASLQSVRSEARRTFSLFADWFQ